MLYSSTRDADVALSADWRWPHFSVRELACRCGGRFCAGEYWHDPEFLDALEGLRRDVGAPLIINSGHRCPQWNAAVGGAPLSRHKQIAVDISLARHDRFQMRDLASKHGFSGRGLAQTFIHLDRRERPATWYYGRSRYIWQT
ncbi:MAG: D-Ala-D-Ala carboxypeptidase family metallohydrolase [Pseudomonadota bacterium]